MHLFDFVSEQAPPYRPANFSGRAVVRRGPPLRPLMSRSSIRWSCCSVSPRREKAICGILLHTNLAVVKPESRAQIERISSVLRGQAAMNLLIVGNPEAGPKWRPGNRSSCFRPNDALLEIGGRFHDKSTRTPKRSPNQPLKQTPRLRRTNLPLQPPLPVLQLHRIP